jgi:SAM-dependent methyltransferase
MMNAFQQNDATYSQNNDFDDWLKLAGKDYEYLLSEVHWEALLSRTKRILDVGCGKAFFPSMLFRQINVSGASLEYSALDPVQSCLDRSGEILSSFPIRMDGFYKTTIEEADLSERFDLIWCLKSLYLVEASLIRESLLKINQMLGEEGVAILFHCTGGSFIIDYHNNVYNKSSLAQDNYCYNTAEKIEEELESTGIQYLHACGSHETRIPTEDKEILANYLSKGSLITPVSFNDLVKDERIRSHLEGRIEFGEYVFSHSYKVVIFGPGMKTVETNSNFELSK